GLLNEENVERLRQEYTNNEPFKYARVETLFQDDLLRKVKDECLTHLSFTEKETDIYRVNQTGDLASLDYLTKEQVALLPNLLALRNILYSEEFRAFLQKVTGCGPISGSKQDMSVNTYKKGCYLLNHDDVIGTRRVSYILYMPLPCGKSWKPEYGGALEFYPVVEGTVEPQPTPSRSTPPSWNQFIFFEVQPGRSHHSVEEVVVEEGSEGYQRLSISGWFHAAQPGEPGYTEEDKDITMKSTREQLYLITSVLKEYSESAEIPDPTADLSQEHLSLLSEFINPVYLQPRLILNLSQRFQQEGSLELHSFLNSALAKKLKKALLEADLRDGIGDPERQGRIPPHSAGVNDCWELKGPPSRYRYLTLKPQPESAVEFVFPRSEQTSPDQIIRSVSEELFKSDAFRAWLMMVTTFLPISYEVEARRFRPGLDYTLATSDMETRLDVVLGLTPPPPTLESASKAGKKGKDKGKLTNVSTEDQDFWPVEWGGSDTWQAPDEEGDPAVYQTGYSKNLPQSTQQQTSYNAQPGPSSSSNGDYPKSKRLDAGSSDRGYGDESSEEEAEGTLLFFSLPGFNKLVLALRDPAVLRFVSYLSAAAQGSRWDVGAQYEVGMLEGDSEDDEDQ
ncbi:nuclear protein, partial [Thelephora ganbajun]